MLSQTRVLRPVVLLERDDHGVPQAVERDLTVALARCQSCGHRCRVLPSDVLPRKTYSLPVIERLAMAYAEGEGSLREVAWSLLGEHTPQHTTLHAWTEGLGAHASGRPQGDVHGGDAFAAVLAETRARWPLAEAPEPWIDPRRYRSEPRHERLIALAGLGPLARSIPGVAAQAPLTGWRQLALGFGLACPLTFRTGRSCTWIGHGDRARVDPEPPSSPHQGSRSCPSRSSRTMSPPGASSRSPPSSAPPSARPIGDA